MNDLRRKLKLTELNQDLSSVVRVAAEGEKAHTANGAFVAGMRGLESILLNIADTLHEETYRPENDSGNITPGSKVRLFKLCHVGAI